MGRQSAKTIIVLTEVHMYRGTLELSNSYPTTTRYTLEYTLIIILVITI